MKYFAKYIPVEGDVLGGNRMGLVVETNEVMYISPMFKEVAEKKGLLTIKKVKLFLCSRDIQMNDVLTDINTGEKIPYSLELVGRQVVKVIGEISSEAKWVKDGDEFGEEEIIRTYSERDYDPEAEEADWYTYQIKGSDPDPKCPDSWHFNPIKIKCSNCRTFH